VFVEEFSISWISRSSSSC